ncbi:MAG: hypothetical protein C0501_08250 [Isosphaera sp.]|nr:hypothetical protein [Isosphaera sp.]
MNLAAVALAGLALGQPAAPNFYPFKDRAIKFPIGYDKDPKTIRQVELWASRDQGATWAPELSAPPTQTSFTYHAKDDGLYWFTMVEVDLQGRRLPANLTTTPPDMKVLLDTVQPRVQFTAARRAGDEVVVEWAVEDKNPDDAKTEVHFRPAAGDGVWQQVTLPAGSRNGVRFAPGTPGAVVVRVTAYDVAGNKTETPPREIPAAGQASTSMSPAAPPAPPPPPATTAGTGSPVPAPDFGPVAPPTAPPAAPPPAPAATPPLATVEPRPPAAGGAGQPVPVWTGSPTAGPAAAAPDAPRAQVVNFLAFEMGYDVEARGTSGFGRLDLWVTRDDGRTWLKWSQHDGKAATVRVNLNVPGNPQPEGPYGFRVVPVSGAGLSDREPAGGDAPDFRVVVDVTRPTLDLFPPTGDPTSPDTLVIQWRATDKNFGDDPITVEWADRPTGPWQPAAVGGDVVQAGAGAPPVARRLPNTGQFAWRVPAGLPPRVYLRVTARDAAGNEQQVVTRDPILVDLVKPRAKINGIITPVGAARP